MAVEPHSMAWVAGQRGPDRSGESWCQVLAMAVCGACRRRCGQGAGAGGEARQGGATHGGCGPRERGNGAPPDGARRVSYPARTPARRAWQVEAG